MGRKLTAGLLAGAALATPVLAGCGSSGESQPSCSYITMGEATATSTSANSTQLVGAFVTQTLAGMWKACAEKPSITMNHVTQGGQTTIDMTYGTGDGKQGYTAEVVARGSAPVTAAAIVGFTVEARNGEYSKADIVPIKLAGKKASDGSWGLSGEENGTTIGLTATTSSANESSVDEALLAADYIVGDELTVQEVPTLIPQTTEH